MKREEKQEKGGAKRPLICLRQWVEREGRYPGPEEVLQRKNIGGGIGRRAGAVPDDCGCEVVLCDVSKRTKGRREGLWWE